MVRGSMTVGEYRGLFTSEPEIAKKILRYPRKDRIAAGDIVLEYLLGFADQHLRKRGYDQLVLELLQNGLARKKTEAIKHLGAYLGQTTQKTL